MIAKSQKELPAVMESKHPASVMVFSVVASNDKIMPPHFIKTGTKINTSECVKILKKF